MSKDNGTFILVLKDGYRVSQLYAVENLFLDVKNIISAYDEKLIWDTEKKASSYAFTLEMENKTEYGVLGIDHYKNHTWEELLEWSNQSS